MDTNTSKPQLQAAIIGLEHLIEAKEKEESQYQQYFEANPIIFTILGYNRSIPLTKQSGQSLPLDESTGLKPEPDFLAQRHHQLWEIFEIKTPVSKSLVVNSNKYRERFTAEVYSYISQTITYENYFTRNPKNREKTNDLFQIKIQEDLDIKIVIGLSKTIDKTKIHQKCREFHYKIDIITFDEILEQLEQAYERYFGIFENIQGFSFHAVVRFQEINSKGKKYFLDIGCEEDRNRISFFLDERADIYFVVCDNDGRLYDLAITISSDELYNEWIYLVCEAGFNQNRFVMTASINGNDTDRREKDQSIYFQTQFQKMVLGTDIKKTNFGCFDIGEKFMYSRTLPFKERNKLIGYISSKYQNLQKVTKYISFDGTKFMLRDNKGNFIQPDEQYQPKYRNAISA